MAHRKPHMVQHLFGAGLRLATDEAPDARHERNRMLVALDAARALERAISEGVVAVRLTALQDEQADPLDVSVELSIGRVGHQDADVCPAFTFNLRDAYVAGTRDGADAASLERIARMLPAFEALVAQMRRNARGVYRSVHRVEGEMAEMES